MVRLGHLAPATRETAPLSLAWYKESTDDGHFFVAVEGEHFVGSQVLMRLCHHHFQGGLGLGSEELAMGVRCHELHGKSARCVGI